MKILMVAPQPFFTPRGTPLSVYYRAKILSELGHEIDLLTYPLGHDVDIKNVNIIRSPGLPFLYDIKIGPSFTKLLLDIPLFLKAVKLMIKNRYDVIHAHEEAVFFCLLFRYLFKKNYIYDMHSSLPQQLGNFNFTKLKMVVKLFEYLEKLSIEGASAVITICDDLDELVKKYGYEEKNELIQNTLFSPLIFIDDLCNINLKNIINSDGKKIILYAGTFEPYQGLDMYIESIKTIVRERQDLVFIFIGGNTEQVSKMRKKAEELNISEYLVFTGMLEVNLVKRFIREADVLVSPRLKGTNTPLKIYEYMASGVPVVATNLKTHTQELTDESAFLTRPEQEDFALGILQCLGSKEEAERRARNAYMIYSRKYGEEVYKQKLGRIIELVSNVSP
ncbi:MAG: glycosyltransferase family 4 protein [Nitrospirota bacterium]